MAERLSDIVTQTRNIRQLNAVVTAMRGIAASRAQRGRALLAGIEAYTAVISNAIGEALTLLPADGVAVQERAGAKRGLILFCAEQGFAGAFSERVFDAAGDRYRRGRDFRRRHARGGRRRRARHHARLVGCDDDAHRRDRGFRQPARRGALRLSRQAGHRQSRHPVRAFRGRLDPHRSAFAAADRFHALCSGRNANSRL